MCCASRSRICKVAEESHLRAARSPGFHKWAQQQQRATRWADNALHGQRKRLNARAVDLSSPRAVNRPAPNGASPSPRLPPLAMMRFSRSGTRLAPALPCGAPCVAPRRRSAGGRLSNAPFREAWQFDAAKQLLEMYSLAPLLRRSALGHLSPACPTAPCRSSPCTTPRRGVQRPERGGRRRRAAPISSPARWPRYAATDPLSQCRRCRPPPATRS